MELGAVLTDPITPFRWTAATGMVLLSPNSFLGSALATSPTGDVVVGYNYDDEQGDSSAFVWDDALGVFSIPGLIDQAGLSGDITGRAISAVDLSKNGKVIVGATRNFENFAEGSFVLENILTVARGE